MRLSTSEGSTRPIATNKPVTGNPLGYDLACWQSVMQELGQPSYRAQQLVQWIHQKGQLDYQEMSNLPAALKAQLAEQRPIDTPRAHQIQRAQDGVCKLLFQLDTTGGSNSGNVIETVLIPAGNRLTLCVSSQVGCALACVFCETGRQGFSRNMTASEIISQLWVAHHLLPHAQSERVSNIVFMGMGEPLLNLPAVEQALSLIFSDHGYGIARRKVTVSTAGLAPAINRLKPGPTLALSLHAPSDDLRSELVPINRKFPIKEVMDSCRNYLYKLPDRRPLTVEYTLLEGINDSMAQAKDLVSLLKRIPCKVNLIPYNPVPGLDFSAPSESRTNAFLARLSEYLPVTLRRPRGREIAAACGQLAGQIQAKGRIGIRQL